MDRAMQRKVDMLTGNMKEGVEELVEDITTDHENELSTKDERISELESEVANLKTTISDLESELQEERNSRTG